jgi:hypothetical protein
MVKFLASEQARRRRHRSPEAEAAYALYEYERRRFGRRGKGIVSVSFAACQLKRFNYRSVISGSKKGLRLRRFWPDVALNDWNCVVVTKQENQSLAHARQPFAKFSPLLISLMQTHRQLDEFDEKERRNSLDSGSSLNDPTVHTLAVS